MIKVIFILLFVVGCGKYDPPEENYADFYTENGNTLRVDHAKSDVDCFMCHQEDGIHLEDRVDGISFDRVATEAQIEREGVPTSCMNCHGT